VPRWLKLPELTQDGHDIRTECAGTIAGGWFAKPIIMGEALIAAGLLINAGPTDMDLLTRWLSTGFARRGVCGSPMMRAAVGKSGEVLVLHDPASHSGPHPEPVNAERDDGKEPPLDVVPKQASARAVEP
jgi:hypothetical protein